MSKFSVSSSALINAPAEKIYAVVRDFKQWPAWSPWIVSEPDCKLTYADDGKSYQWEGEVIGSGEMAIESDTPNAEITYTLTFLKPWRSKSSVKFTFEPKSDDTLVTWEMEGSLPFFMFWMKRMMAAYVEMDYERGLLMLKDYIETGSVPSKLDFVGEEDFAGCQYVGIKTSCAIPEIGMCMESDFTKLKAGCTAMGVEPNGIPFSIYHQWEPVKGLCEYTIGFPVGSVPGSLADGLIAGELPDSKVYSIRHTGPYRHLGNAWSAGFVRIRSKLIHQSKQHPFETYESNPDETPENELVTTIRFPVKA